MKYLKSHKTFFVCVVILISLALIIFSLGKKYAPSTVEKSIGFLVTPVQNVINNISDWFKDKQMYFSNIASLTEENIFLNEEVARLEEENNRLKLIDEENRNLSALLNVDRMYSVYPKIGANIIAKDPGNWYNTFLINKGSKDGVQKDMVVLASGGLAGRITKAGYNYAVVTTMIDDTSWISAKSAKTGDSGYVKGDASLMLEGLCKMIYIEPDAEITVDDEITTSHLSSIYPPGISIGYVSEIWLDTDGTKTALIVPNVEFRNMDTVLVITELFDHELQDEKPEPSEKAEYVEGESND